MHATISAAPGLTLDGMVTVTTKVPSKRTSRGLLTRRCRFVPWRMATVAGLARSKPSPEMVNGLPILAVLVEIVIAGRVALGDGLGDGITRAAITWRTVSTGQEPFQQRRTM